MKKIFQWGYDHILFLSTLFLLAFIPLYPKLPLLDVTNTWVYIRAEDFVVLLVLGLWGLLMFSKKITLKTPLTVPILVFWIIGAVATMHGVVIIFPATANVFPNVAFLSYLRHIEYMSLFFIAYSGMRDKRFLNAVIGVLIVTLLAVTAYGFGQKYLGYPAYLTGNEEFAKGIPIQLSQLSRVPSTFAGHYDLAAYLVLIIPILASLFIGFKKWSVKILLFVTVTLGFSLLFMTVSRVSFVGVLVALFLVLLFHKKRLVLYTLPLLLGISFLFLVVSPSLLSRFGNTVREVDVVINSETGESIGHLQYVPSNYLEDKLVKQRRISNDTQLNSALRGKIDDIQEASPSGEVIVELLPDEIPLVLASNISTGENLPQGTGYINLSLSPVVKRLGNFFYERAPNLSSTTSAEVILIHGNFLVKRAAAYDLSFTTRFQGEWPNALRAFQENILFGSGYGSVSLAVDNNYLRILGEVGILGLLSFIAIFVAIGLYIKKVLPYIESKVARSFILGFAAGVIGLALNATLIDVFEASKVAFILWILAGITVGIISLYDTQHTNLINELKKAVTSSIAIVLYLAAGVVIIFSPMLSNYFVGDDFTWFRWAADCTALSSSGNCPGTFSSILNYFTNSEGFFYRPGPKTYFHLMYSFFWLNQAVYHLVSIFLHFIVVALFYIISKKILRSGLLAGLAAFLFLMMSGYLEVVYWISSTQYLFNAVFSLSALLLFILWEEKKKPIYYLSSILSIFLAMLFHEVGVVVPLLLVAYKIIYREGFNIRNSLKLPYLSLFAPVAIYLIVRFMANSHWFGGDYSYNILKLPLNIFGNSIGYILITIFGPITIPLYESMRSLARDNIFVAAVIIVFITSIAFFAYKRIIKFIDLKDKRTIVFGSSIFVISLLPFLGLGNMSSRYSYMAAFGTVLILVVVIKKVYEYLSLSGRDIALVGVVSLVSVFSLFHIIQIQQLQLDWHGAGDKSRNFFVAINDSYSDYWSENSMEIHFINVPIKNGNAWVFPVGLEDALWFAFENSDLSVYQHATLDDALVQIGGYTSRTVKIFEFDGNDVREVIRPNPQAKPLNL